MEFGAYLTGPFGQSQSLYKVRNNFKRGRGSEASVKEQILVDTREIIGLQKKSGLDFVVDPMFNWFYLFQAFNEGVTGVEVGPQENWFDNNVFFWRPRISGPLGIQKGFTERYIHLDELPRDGTAMVILPSPYSLLMFSDIRGYKSKEEAVADIARVLHAEAEHLVSKGVGRIQYDEPAIVVKQSLGSLRREDLGLLRIAMDICGSVRGATTVLSTYFGDAGPLISYLLSLNTGGLGIDVTETKLDDISKYDFSRKELALGIVNARSVSLESPRDLVRRIKIIAGETKPKRLWVTPNTGTEYKGFTHGVDKLRLVAQIRGMLNE